MLSHSCIADKNYPRLDRYISEVLRLLSRSQIKARKLNATVNGKSVKISREIEKGDKIELSWEDELPVNIIPEDLPLDIIYEDERCIVVNKVQGMVVHPGAGNRQGTLANVILHRINQINKTNVNEKCGLRPGIVHRLDKDTTGVIIAAFDEETHSFLADQFKNRKVKKTYIAIVNGSPKEQKGKIENYIIRDQKDRKKFSVSKDGDNQKGKKAITYYKVIKTIDKNRDFYSLILLRPKTGRTHQLRVHMKHLGCPILGDPIYNKQDKNFFKATLMLHAKKLEITLPGEGHPTIFNTPVPERFKEIMNIFSHRDTENTEDFKG